MAKLGSDKRPAVVRVRTMPKGEEIVALCERYHWKVIVGMNRTNPKISRTSIFSCAAPPGSPRLLARRPGSAAMIIALAGVARSSRTAVQPFEHMEAQYLGHANRRTYG